MRSLFKTKNIANKYCWTKIFIFTFLSKLIQKIVSLKTFLTRRNTMFMYVGGYVFVESTKLFTIIILVQRTMPSARQSSSQCTAANVLLTMLNIEKNCVQYY